MLKRYAETPSGQVHCRIWPGDVPNTPPLVCLHAIPYSGLHYSVLAPRLGWDAAEATCQVNDYAAQVELTRSWQGE